MNEWRFEATSPEQLGPLLNCLEALARQYHILTFSGEPGAGKTTLIAMFCAQLGVQETVSSPTFSLINEYRSPKGNIIHADWYRVHSAEELFDAGMLEYLDSGSLCLVEWPSVVPEIWEQYPHIAVEISQPDGHVGRSYRVTG